SCPCLPAFFLRKSGTRPSLLRRGQSTENFLRRSKMSSSFIDLLKDWGLGGVMGVGGCYLVVGSIAGKIIPIGNYVPLVRLRLRQRVLLAGFGCVLALPIIWSSYGQMINGTRGILFQPPETPERVAAPKTSDQQPRGELPANSVRLARFTGETRAVLAS